MRRNFLGIAVYLILAFGLPWAAWGVPLALGATPQSSLFQAFVLAGAFAPALAALVVRTCGRARALPMPVWGSRRANGSITFSRSRSPR